MPITKDEKAMPLDPLANSIQKQFNEGVKNNLQAVRLNGLSIEETTDQIDLIGNNFQDKNQLFLDGWRWDKSTATSQLLLIDDAETLWTADNGNTTPSANTTAGQFIQGSQSVKLSGTAAGTIAAYFDTVLDLTFFQSGASSSISDYVFMWFYVPDVSIISAFEIWFYEDNTNRTAGKIAKATIDTSGWSNGINTVYVRKSDLSLLNGFITSDFALIEGIYINVTITATGNFSLDNFLMLSSIKTQYDILDSSDKDVSGNPDNTDRIETSNLKLLSLDENSRLRYKNEIMSRANELYLVLNNDIAGGRGQEYLVNAITRKTITTTTDMVQILADINWQLKIPYFDISNTILKDHITYGTILSSLIPDGNDTLHNLNIVKAIPENKRYFLQAKFLFEADCTSQGWYFSKKDGDNYIRAYITKDPTPANSTYNIEAIIEGVVYPLFTSTFTLNDSDTVSLIVALDEKRIDIYSSINDGAYDLITADRDTTFWDGTLRDYRQHIGFYSTDCMNVLEILTTGNDCCIRELLTFNEALEVIQADATGTDTYAVTTGKSVSIFNSKVFIINFANTNTGASTLNIDGIGAKDLVKNVSTPLDPTDITVGKEYIVLYDISADKFQIKDVGSSGGETNTASNVGAGAEVFKQKTGVDFEFRTITDTGNIIVTENANEIDIYSPYEVEAGVVVGGTDTYTLTTGKSLVLGDLDTMVFEIKFANTNTTTSTLNVDGIGAITLKKNITDNLIAGDIQAGKIYTIVYDGTNFQVITGIANASFSTVIVASSITATTGRFCLSVNNIADTRPQTFAQMSTLVPLIVCNDNAGARYTGITFELNTGGNLAKVGMYGTWLEANRAGLIFVAPNESAVLQEILKIYPERTATSVFGSFLLDDRTEISNPQGGSQNESFGLSARSAGFVGGSYQRNTSFGYNANAIGSTLDNSTFGSSSSATNAGSSFGSQAVSTGGIAIGLQANSNVGIAIGHKTTIATVATNGDCVVGNSSTGLATSAIFGHSIINGTTGCIGIGRNINMNSLASNIILSNNAATKTMAGTNAVIISDEFTNPAANVVGIGYGVNFGSFTNTILMGRATAAKAVNQFIAGSTTMQIKDIYFGIGTEDVIYGTQAASSTDRTMIHGNNATSFNNIWGGTLALAGGTSRGTFGGGSVEFHTAPAGAVVGVTNSIRRVAYFDNIGTLLFENQTVVDTNFRKVFNVNGSAIWTGNGTNPSSLTTPTHANGDLVVNGDSGKLYARISGAWVDLSATGIAIPSGEVVYGTGASVTSEAAFSYNAGTNTLTVDNLTAASTLTVLSGVFLSHPGTAANSEIFGGGSTATAAQTTGIGRNMSLVGVNTIGVGYGISSGSGQRQIFLGDSSGGSSDAGHIIIGFNGSVDGTVTESMGLATIGLELSISNAFILGSRSGSGQVNSVYVGHGVETRVAGAVNPVTIYTSEGCRVSGLTTNAHGRDMILSPGTSTGSGTAGVFKIQTARASGSGNTRNAYSVKVTLDGDGLLIFDNQTTVTTNFRKIQSFQKVGGGYASIWVSDGTDPNGTLSGTAGDICLNGASNQPSYCTGTTNWTGM